VEVTSENMEEPYYNTNPNGSIQIPDSVMYNGITYLVSGIGEFAFFGCDQIMDVTMGNHVLSIMRYAFAYCEKVSTIYIPENVTYFGIGVFCNCIELKYINIPNGIKEISHLLFWRCLKLKNIRIPDSVTSIGGEAFFSCHSLTRLDIPDATVRIYSMAFSECIQLDTFLIGSNNKRFKIIDGILYTKNMDTLLVCAAGKKGNITIPNTVKWIDLYAFSECGKLTGPLVIPNSVTYICDNAFKLCTGFNSLQIGDSVKYIGNSVFYSCNKISGAVIIPNAVSYLGLLSFHSCSNIDSIFLSDSLNLIDLYVFYECSKLKYIHFGELISLIKRGAFQDCDGLKELIIPNTVKKIEEESFIGCSGLTSVIIGDSVKSIGGHAFSNCGNLKYLTIGKSIQDIWSYAFYEDINLKEINIKTAFPPNIKYTSFEEVPDTILLYVPCGSSTYYQSDTNWNKFSNIQEGDMEYCIKMKVNNDYFGTTTASTPDCITYQSILTAIPSRRHLFTQWSDGNTDNPRTVIVTSDTTFTAIFTYTSAIEEQGMDNFIKIYPNPANEFITLENKQNIMKEVCMYDISGREVKRISISTNKITLDVSDLQRGMYVMKVSTEKGVITRKIQIIR